MTKLYGKAARVAALVGLAATLGTAAAAQQPRTIAGATCNNPPRINCPESNCLPEFQGAQGPAIEPNSGRPFFVDFPCDLKPGEDVIFVLNLHGGGSVGNWQRHYFPVVDLKEEYRLVVATPTAAATMPGRRWIAEDDDQYLRDISDLVIGALGPRNIKSFWLAGHSQGGATSRRIVCSDYFRDKVDGFLSLSGGRIGTPPNPEAGGGGAAQPDCDFSFIYTTGELEATGQNMPTQSTWAAKYGCGERVRQDDVVDTDAGYVTATDQSRGPSWGTFARPGAAEVFVYPGCQGGRVVADVVRINKGHTEGLEPNVLDTIVGMMAGARGGKISG